MSSCAVQHRCGIYSTVKGIVHKRRMCDDLTRGNAIENHPQLDQWGNASDSHSQLDLDAHWNYSKVSIIAYANETDSHSQWGGEKNGDFGGGRYSI